MVRSTSMRAAVGCDIEGSDGGEQRRAVVEGRREKWKRYGTATAGMWIGWMEELTKAMRRPWKAGEFPEVAAWLEQNAAALEMVVKASGRERLCPALPEGGDAMNFSRQVGLSNIRDYVNAFVARDAAAGDGGIVRGALADVDAGGDFTAVDADAVDDHRADGGGKRRTGGAGGTSAAVRGGTAAEAREWLAKRLGSPEVRMGPAAVDVDMRFDLLNYVMLVLRGNWGSRPPRRS